MIYIEPAPYILDLIRVLREEHPGLLLHVLFISENASQPWGEMPEDEGLELLPSGRLAVLRRIASLIRSGQFDWLHLAGWGHPLLTAALLIGAAHGRKISMESDTQLPSLAAQVRGRRDAIRSELGVAESACLFVYVGRLEAHKGLALLLQAFEQLEQPGVGLLIVGDGTCRSLVEAAVEQDARIRYVGRRDFAGVTEAFAISDVAVVPSEFEPWGLVVNEAMAAGLPVIASDRVGAVDDLVVDGETGLVVDAGLITSLQDAMHKLVDDRDLCLSMGQNSLDLIRKWDLSAEAEIMVEGWKDA
ncbi:glycosyltransferase family 4 protein [Mariprofundus sp. KV]|uniref:glycosyltransferase family 4 protein n=1 Tax=Mariprofundus sp. KV TaxID=2608715 RepID=UPI001F50A9CF|nr:glycosyltransferase family 4 protein [Mariprofundus sp. KV]